jgi:hypothetical protein
MTRAICVLPVPLCPVRSLAGAALSGQEHRLRRPRGDGHLPKDCRHRLAAADDLVELELRPQHARRVVAVVETLLQQQAIDHRCQVARRGNPVQGCVRQDPCLAR